MASDSELIGRLRELLESSDLNTTTTATVRRRLEEDLGIDLSDKKAFIREQVDLYLQSRFEEAETGGADRLEEADSEEPVRSDEEEEEGTSHGKGDGMKRFRSNKLNNEVKKRGGGFSKLCSLSPQLQEFLGESELARTVVVKQMWIYIREKDLQDPSNRRDILCDERLRALFGVESINMFQVNKALSKHIWPLDSDDVVPVKSPQKERKQKQKREEEPDEPKQKRKRQKGGKSGFLAPLHLSDALVKFLGTGEGELSRGDVVKRIWTYIKENNLQDPSDKRRILCDEKLKELFDADSFHGFTVSKFLVPHFIKPEQ